MTILVWTGGCGGSSPVPPTSPAPGVLVSRHWDQVCRPDYGAPRPMEIHELLDTVAVSDRWSGDRGSPRTAQGVTEPAAGPAASRISRSADGVPPDTVEWMLWFRRDGTLREELPWRTTVSPSDLSTAHEALRVGLRPLPGLLTDMSVRVRLVRDHRVRAELPPALECMPHMVHHDRDPPVGLPDSVTTVYGRSRSRPGEPVATVRISLDASGRVLAVDSVAGPGPAVAAVRSFIGDLRFDPALRNGVPVHGELLQSFRFRSPTFPGDGGNAGG